MSHLTLAIQLIISDTPTKIYSNLFTNISTTYKYSMVLIIPCGLSQISWSRTHSLILIHRTSKLGVYSSLGRYDYEHGFRARLYSKDALRFNKLCAESHHSRARTAHYLCVCMCLGGGEHQCKNPVMIVI